MYFSSTVQFKEVSGAEDKAEKAATWPVHPRVALSPQEPRRTCLASSRQARRSVLLRRCPLCDSGRLPGALGAKRPPVPWGNTRRPRLSDCERRQRERPGAASRRPAGSEPLGARTPLGNERALAPLSQADRGNARSGDST